MNRRNFINRCIAALLAPAILAPLRVAEAANIMNYIESVRVHSAVVYVGTASSVEFLGRSQFGITARATLSVQAVARGQVPATGQASLRYSTYDDQTPANDGGLQYKIRNHATVLVFADSFEEGSPSALWQGTPAEIMKVIESLADGVEKMSGEDLTFNRISQADRVSQLALYNSLLTMLRSAPAT